MPANGGSVTPVRLVAVGGSQDRHTTQRDGISFFMAVGWSKDRHTIHRDRIGLFMAVGWSK